MVRGECSGGSHIAFDFWSSFVLKVLVDVADEFLAVLCRCCARLVAGKSEGKPSARKIYFFAQAKDSFVFGVQRGGWNTSAHRQARPTARPYPYTEECASFIHPYGAATHPASAITHFHQLFSPAEAFIHGIHPTLVLVRHVVPATNMRVAFNAAVHAPGHHGDHRSEHKVFVHLWS